MRVEKASAMPSTAPQRAAEMILVVVYDVVPVLGCGVCSARIGIRPCRYSLVS